jgi:PAS domain S-box-containing protein
MKNSKYIIVLSFIAALVFTNTLNTLYSSNFIKDSAVLMGIIVAAVTFIFYGILSCMFKNRERPTENKKTNCQAPSDVKNETSWSWEVDANGLYIYCSPEVESVIGYKPEELVGKKHFYDLFISQEREGLKVFIFERFAEKTSFLDFININIHKDGRLITLKSCATPTVDQDGVLTGYKGTDKVISEHDTAILTSASMVSEESDSQNCVEAFNTKTGEI